MSTLTDLQTSKSNLTAAIAAATANPKPNYSVGDQTFSWADYLKMLTDQLLAINQLLVVEQPFEEISSGTT